MYIIKFEGIYEDDMVSYYRRMNQAYVLVCDPRRATRFESEYLCQLEIDQVREKYAYVANRAIIQAV